MASNNYLLVVAIDFGTTFSGYAFSFKGKLHDIKMNKSWGASLGFQSYKTPTTVLVDPKGELETFGFEAEEKYFNMKQSEVTPDQYALYQKFKMLLHRQKISESLLVHSTNGNIRPAIDVFAMSLEYLKDHIIKAISIQVTSKPRVADIRWVLTVPAIWGDGAKQFMRKAALKAKLIDAVDSEQLVIALEPEAASLYCRSLEMKQFQGMEMRKGKLSLGVNTKYMIIDAGGGTIDITVHQTQPNDKVKELYKANGGPWGGSYVDEMYEQLLCQIFGSAFIKDYKLKFPHQWLNMMVDFEKRKRAAKPQNDSSTNIPLNMGFARQYERFTGKEFESVFEVGPKLGVQFSTEGMLRITPAKMAELFQGVLTKTERHLRSLMIQQAVNGVTHIFLVGGFGESAYMQEMVKRTLANRRCTVLIPEEASMCVLKGAVLFGHNLKAISSRISRFSYAVLTYRNFIDGEDNQRLKETLEGIGDKIECLKPLVKVGEELPLQTIRSTILNPLRPDQVQVSLDLYSSTDVLHDTRSHPSDSNAVYLASITVDSPDISKGTNRDIKVSITFGGTEMHFHAQDVVSGNDSATTVSFNV